MPLLSKPAKEMIIDQINAANNPAVPIDSTNIYFGNPHLDTDGITSIAPAVGVLGSQYEKVSTFKYRRINLSQMYDTYPVISAVGTARLYGMLSIINQALGLNFTEDDLYDSDVTLIQPGSQVFITLQAQPKSVGIRGLRSSNLFVCVRLWSLRFSTRRWHS